MNTHHGHIIYNNNKRLGAYWAGSVCMPGIIIGRDSQLAAGAVATKNVPDGEIWVGVPAKYLRDVPDDEIGWE